MKSKIILAMFFVIMSGLAMAQQKNNNHPVKKREPKKQEHNQPKPKPEQPASNKKAGNSKPKQEQISIKEEGTPQPMPGTVIDLEDMPDDKNNSDKQQPEIFIAPSDEK